MGGLVKAYVFYWYDCTYRILALGCVDGIRRLTMTMKAFKAALKAKIKFAEENCKTNDDYYLGYISAMEDILVYIEGGEEDGNVY